MEIYMKVLLKEKYMDEDFIMVLNHILSHHYGASNPNELFNCWETLMQVANFTNEFGGSTEELRRLKKPVTPHLLAKKVASLRYGYFEIELTGQLIPEECLDAISIHKWITNTESRYIDLEASQYYGREILTNYLNPILMDHGYDLNAIWK